MKKNLLIAVLGLTLSFLTGFTPPQHVSEQSQSAIWLAANPEIFEQIPEVEIESHSDTTVTLDVRFPGIWAEALQTENGTFTKLSLNAYGNLSQPGQPDLPTFSSRIEVPAGVQPQVKVLDKQTVNISLGEYGLPDTLFPAQQPSPKSGPQPEWTPPDTQIYHSGDVFPGSSVSLLSPYELREHKFQPIAFWPVQYLPVEGKLQLLTEIKIEISWPTLPQSYMQDTAAFDSTDFMPLLAGNVISGSQSGSDTNLLTGTGTSYLIIAPDSFTAALFPFVELKRQTGLQVQVVPLSDIGETTVENIKYFIQQAYENWSNPPSYLLLVGDTNLIPAWSGKDPLFRKSTDLYYATMDGEADYVPDIFYGRLPVRTVQQVSELVDKLVFYEQTTGTESWIKKAAFIASSDSDHFTIPEGTHDFVMEQYTTPAGFTGIFPENPQNGGDHLYRATYSANTNDILNAIDDQRSLITYSGHGSVSGWEGGFSQDTVRGLTSVPVFPFVTSFACETNDYAQEEVFGETWLLQPQKGAIAFLGSADYSYWDQDDILERALYASLFTDPANPINLGPAFFDGLDEVQNNYPEFARYYWETYNLLGDPSLKLWLDTRQPDYVVYASPNETEICSGDKTETTEIHLVANNGFDEPVALTISGTPPGLHAAFQENSLTPTAQTTLTLTAGNQLTAGTYPLAIEASNTSRSHGSLLTVYAVDQAPNVPQLFSPEQGSLDQPVNPVFNWQAVDQARQYHLEIAADAEFNRVIIQRDITSSSYRLNLPLDSDTTYYWRIAAKNACGIGPFSDVHQFTTLPGVESCPEGFETINLYESDAEESILGWNFDETIWSMSTDRAKSPITSFFATEPVQPGVHYLISPTIQIPALTSNPTLRFWQWRDLEPADSGCLDGSVLEYSIDNGISWQPIDQEHLLSAPYSGVITDFSDNLLAGRSAWCGLQNWQKTVVDLNGLQGQSVLFRFAQSTNTGNDQPYEGTYRGWNIDDISMQTCKAPYQVALPWITR